MSYDNWKQQTPEQETFQDSEIEEENNAYWISSQNKIKVQELIDYAEQTGNTWLLEKLKKLRL